MTVADDVAPVAGDDKVIVAKCPVDVTPELDVARVYVLAVTTEAVDARSRANPAMPNSAVVVTFPDVVAVCAVIVVEATTVPEVSVTYPLAPDNSKIVQEEVAVPVRVEENCGAVSPPAAGFHQIDVRARVPAEAISMRFTQPEPPVRVVAVVDVVAVQVTTATRTFPADAFCPVP